MKQIQIIIKTLSVSLAVLAVTCCEPKHYEVAGGVQPKDIIPAPVEYSVQSGSIGTDELTNLPEKVRISESAVRRRLKGRKLEDWQLRSTYWLEIGRKGVKIEAADQEGVFYARQSLKISICEALLLFCMIVVLVNVIVSMGTNVEFSITPISK